MAHRKTATLNLRVDPKVEEALREAAQIEHRSVANMAGRSQLPQQKLAGSGRLQVGTPAELDRQTFRLKIQ